MKSLDSRKADNERARPAVTLRFVAGTLEIHGWDVARGSLHERCLWDERAVCWRVQAVDYAPLMRHFKTLGIDCDDQARAYVTLELNGQGAPAPRPYQNEALLAWNKEQGRGVVVLPTGAGKTQVALMAILAKQRATLVVVPTLDLVQQWIDRLQSGLGTMVGCVGGGEYRLEPVTVSTYDSAYIHMEHWGGRFGLIVFDECHHLPSESYATIARGSLAPFRLGLTATPERADGRENLFAELIGPIVYRRDIVEFSGNYLADYDIESRLVDLTAEERTAYDRERGLYRAFLQQQRISFAEPQGWARFVALASRSRDGRRAFQGFLRQREIAFCASQKLHLVEEILLAHRQERTLFFTQDNATAYRIARQFLLPIITHQTRVRERARLLDDFRSGQLRALVTSKVLNEGVDVPEASVAVVISGSGSVREHVQRLGRILRPQAGKRAKLYELITRDSGEMFTSQRRREHSAYR